jgi:branched-chain amino acid transport system substrate-binding protein
VSTHRLGALLAAAWFIAAASHALAEKRYGPGVTDTEILIGQTMPYSGAGSAYGAIGKAQVAYFAAVNAAGGINGRKVKLLSLDDAYLPPKTVEHVRRLVEQDQVLLIFSSVGTATKGVPHLFVAGGDSAWGDHERYPWTMGWMPSYRHEASLYAQHILKTRPDARIALFSLNDDYGRDYVAGFKAALGDRARTMIVGEQTYEATDPTVDTQIVSLKASGADTLMSAMAGKHASQALRKMGELGWKPAHYTGIASASVRGVLEPAGLDNAVGLISAYYAKAPDTIAFSQDVAIRAYLEWAKKYYDGNAYDGIAAHGYQVAQAMEYVLRKCGDDLSRENIMRVATSMTNVEFPMLYPGVRVTTSKTDYYPIEDLILLRFDGRNWQLAPQPK